MMSRNAFERYNYSFEILHFEVLAIQILSQMDDWWSCDWKDSFFLHESLRPKSRISILRFFDCIILIMNT
jgi:hypothetical protein